MRTSKPNEPIFYVYAYLDPRKPGDFNFKIEEKDIHFDYEPFYIGKGHDDRMYNHLAEAKRSNKNNLKLNKIRKILNTNLSPIIIPIYENLIDSEALRFENLTIKSIGRLELDSGPLTNLTDGGDGISGRIFPKEVLKKIRKSVDIFWSNDDNKKRHSLILKEWFSSHKEEKIEMERKRQETVHKRLDEDPNWTSDIAKRSAKTRKETGVDKIAAAKFKETLKNNPQIIEKIINENIITWSNPEKKKEHSVCMKEALSRPEVKEKLRQTHASSEFKERKRKSAKEGCKKRAKMYEEHPERMLAKTAIHLKNIEKQKEVRYWCQDIIKKYNIDIKTPHCNKGVNDWIELKEQLELIIKDMVY
jgi:hypothetical protein